MLFVINLVKLSFNVSIIELNEYKESPSLNKLLKHIFYIEKILYK